MNIFHSILIILILSFQPLSAKAQTCRAFYHPLDNVSEWTDLIKQTGKKQGTISLDLFDNRNLNSKSFGKLMNLLERLATDPKMLNSNSIEKITDQLVKQLYEVANASNDEKINISNLGLNDSLMKALHRELFYQIVRSDLQSALQEYSHIPKPPNPILKPFVVTKEKWRAFIKKNGAKVRIGFWASIHLPLAAFGQYFPWYLPRKETLKINPKTVEKVRAALNEGDFNLALRTVKSDLDSTYSNPRTRHQIYSLIHSVYNTFASLVLAHVILSSAAVEHFAPSISDTYQKSVVPVIEAVDKNVMSPIVNNIQRLYTNRDNFEKLVLKKVLQQKEEVLGHQIPVGSTEYLETLKHIQNLDLETLEQFFNSMN